MRLSLRVVRISAVAVLAMGSTAFAHSKPVKDTLASEMRNCPEAYRALSKGKMEELYRLTRGKACPRLSKLARWWGLKEGKPPFAFADYAAFIRDHPNWPRLHAIKVNAEYALTESVPDRAILQWFKAQPPRTVYGSLYYIKALRRTGQRERALQTIRSTWINLDFTAQEETNFRCQFKGYLRPRDHFERMNRLLGQEKTAQAQRMLGCLGAEEKAWARARMAILKNAPDLKASLAAVSARLRQNPGLLYERLKHFRKLELDDAFRLFFMIPKSEKDKGLWWTERRILSRRALNAGQPALAYKIMHGHGLRDGEEFAEAEWFMGWVALSFLHKPDAAMKHFETFYHGARTPLSRAKAAYWMGRALERQNAQQARVWYQRSAQAVTSYYGQLSLQKLKIAPHSLRAKTDQITARQREVFAAQEIPQIIRLLGAAGAEELILDFAYVYAKKAPAFSDRYLMLELLHDVAPHYVVAVAKQAERVSPMLVEKAYPTLKTFGLKRRLPVEPAFAHAVIRQESDFNPKSVSGAGAKGLMQLMPTTAKMVATKLNIPYKPHALLQEPAYNLALGMEYLADRLNRYDGSYVLALASYNAGSARVVEWLETFGDPRQPGVDLVHWIEQIPYAETRTYIQRIIANLYIYRNIFNKHF